MREHSLAKVPIILAVGKREAEERTVSVRRLGSQAQTTMTLKEAVAAFVEEALAPDERRAKARWRKRRSKGRSGWLRGLSAREVPGGGGPFARRR